MFSRIRQVLKMDIKYCGINFMVVVLVYSLVKISDRSQYSFGIGYVFGENIERPENTEMKYKCLLICPVKT